MRVHPQAAVLGAPLEAGKDLYPELQEIYIIKFIFYPVPTLQVMYTLDLPYLHSI